MKRMIIFLFLISAVFVLQSQTYFRSGIFLHHSTGIYTWGPNPDGTSTTTIPQQMLFFNNTNGLTGNDSIQMTEEWWSPADNEWSTQHEFFEGNTGYTDINNYLANNKILVVKSCFPSSEIDALGSASDTLNPTYKCIYNYKWHWRHIIKVMENHPENFFAIWTNAPLEELSTTPTQAAFSQSFCRWAKDTLANGLDPEYGAFPPNVYVFDFFSKLTGSDGIMLTQYRTGDYDSHPNGAATDLVAPQFVNEIFAAAMVYESTYSFIQKNTLLEFNIYPNPASDVVIIDLPKTTENLNLVIASLTGQVVFQKTIAGTTANTNSETINVSGITQGTYFVQIQSENFVETRKLVIQ